MSEDEDPALASDMERKAEAIVAAAAANRDELDFSLESLVALDAMLDRLFGRRWPGGRNGRLDAGNFGPMIEPIGAYVGETLRRSLGGTWGTNQEFGPGLLLPSGTWTFPLARAAQRFEEGHDAGMAAYGSEAAGGEGPGGGAT